MKFLSSLWLSNPDSSPVAMFLELDAEDAKSIIEKVEKVQKFLKENFDENVGHVGVSSPVMLNILDAVPDEAEADVEGDPGVVCMPDNWEPNDKDRYPSETHLMLIYIDGDVYFEASDKHGSGKMESKGFSLEALKQIANGEAPFTQIEIEPDEQPE